MADGVVIKYTPAQFLAVMKVVKDVTLSVWTCLLHIRRVKEAPTVHRALDDVNALEQLEADYELLVSASGGDRQR
jgi:hypothetical protein